MTRRVSGQGGEAKKRISRALPPVWHGRSGRSVLRFHAVALCINHSHIRRSR